MQKAVNEQFHELSESVGQAMTQLRDVGDELGKSADTLDSTADKVVERFVEAGDKAARESERLYEASINAVNLTAELVQRVKGESDGLLAVSRESLSELRRAGDSFTMRTREVAEQMATALRTSQSYSDDLRKQARSVAEASSESSDKISKVVSELSGRLDDIGSATSSVVSDIEKAREDLSGESERLVQASRSAISAADDATSAFSRQSSALFKAVQDAAAHAEKIRKEEWRTQRESFMTSAKFIVESLHSLSVDLTRIQEGEAPEKTWKAFQKGDIGAFTRRLAAMGDNLPMDKVRDKFAGDNEFRTYVSRFIRQFEDLYDQAVANDHGDLLGSTFVSSDVGRLYTVLCAAAGREPRMSRERNAA